MIHWSTFVLPASVAFVLDMASKKFAEEVLPGLVLALTPFLNLRLAHNVGISFSLLPADTAGEAGLLVLVTGLLTLLLAWFGLRSSLRSQRIALGLITGGAAANVIDRFVDGRITDFIDAHIGGWHWPTFNLADVAIAVGVVVLVFETFLAKEPARTGG